MLKIISIIFLTFLILPSFSLAAGLVPCGGTGQSPCTFCHIFVLFNNVVEFVMFKLVPPLAVLMLVVGGIMFMLAYFSPAQALPGGAKGGPVLLGRARSVITSVVVGLVIVFTAWVIVNTILTKTGLVDPVRGRAVYEWYKIDCGTGGTTDDGNSTGNGTDDNPTAPPAPGSDGSNGSNPPAP